MTDRHPEWVNGYNAGIQAAWERAMLMANALSVNPATYGAKVIRNTALDIADDILDQKKGTPAIVPSGERSDG